MVKVLDVADNRCGLLLHHCGSSLGEGIDSDRRRRLSKACRHGSAARVIPPVQAEGHGCASTPKVKSVGLALYERGV